VCDLLTKYDIKPLVIGNGSNLLVNDEYHEIIVINTSKLDSISIVDSLSVDSQEYCDISVDAGALLSKVALFAYENGLAGLEFALGIPGTLGGAIVMNAGAYGIEMKDVVYSTTAFNSNDGKFTLTAEENEFSYRQSRFTKTEDVVLSSILRLKPGEKTSIKKEMDDLSARRRESQPLELPSGGSTFKRPEEGYAASLIDQVGLKGFSIGGAQVSKKHSGFIVNTGDATFEDVIAVIEHVQDVVFKQLGIQLEPEIKIVR
jgi:UDP-N-acetylmuramate dehydrogenase